MTRVPVSRSTMVCLAVLCLTVVTMTGCGGDDTEGTTDTTTVTASADTATVVDELADNERRVARGDYGAAWPLTVEAGVLQCEIGVGAVTLEVGGTVYAVNGTAKQEGHADVSEIWADDPNVRGTKMSMRPLLDDGIELCD